MGFASGWKVRSREFTSPLVARCAMGVWKRGCADACVEFFGSLFWGFASGWKVRSREFTSPLVARCANGVLQTRLRRRLR